jgi:hypothetical protein
MGGAARIGRYVTYRGGSAISSRRAKSNCQIWFPPKAVSGNPSGDGF